MFDEVEVTKKAKIKRTKKTITKRLTIPKVNNFEGVFLDYGAIADAIRDSLELRLYIRWAPGGNRRTQQRQYTYGTHRIKSDELGAYHSICLSVNTPLEIVNTTLWHELTHAVQAEKCGTPKAFYRDHYCKYGVTPGSAAYDNNPYEIQACENEANAESMPLAYIS